MIFSTIINLIEAILFGAFYYRVSNSTAERRLAGMITYTLSHFLLIQFINQSSVTVGYFAFLFYLAAFAMLSCCTDYSIGRKIWLSMMPDLLTAVINLYLCILASLLLFHKIDYGILMQKYSVQIIILSKILQFALFYEVSRRLIQNPPRISEKEEYLADLMCFACITAFNSVDGLLFYESYSSTRLAIAIICVGIFSLSMLWMFSHISQRNSSLAEEQKKSMMLDFELKMAKRSLESQEKLRQSRHDLFHVLELLKRDTNPEDENTILKCQSMLGDAALPIETCSSLLNYILNLKREKAEAAGLHIICCLNISPDSDFISSEDLTILITNLLDNAIEHNISEGEIRLEIKADSSSWLISVSNPISEQGISAFQEYLTQGKKGSYGFGLKGIERIAKNYHGNTRFLISNFRFSARAVLFSD